MTAQKVYTQEKKTWENAQVMSIKWRAEFSMGRFFLAAKYSAYFYDILCAF